MRYEVLLRSKYHDTVIIPYAVVSHIGVDTLLSHVCNADEEARRDFFNQLDEDRRNIYAANSSQFVLAVVIIEHGAVPLSLSPQEFFSYEEDADAIPPVGPVTEDPEYGEEVIEIMPGGRIATW